MVLFYSDLKYCANKDYKLYVFGLIDTILDIEIIEYLLLFSNTNKLNKICSFTEVNITNEMKNKLEKQCLELYNKNNNIIKIAINEDNINFSNLSIIQYIFF